ncbi:tetratricopeptide repeat protein [Candidatus Dependentiae bacterium]
MSRKRVRSATISEDKKNYFSHNDYPKLPLWQRIIPPSILAILTTIFYYPSLKYPFQFDDLANITKKFSIRHDNPLARWLTNSRWMGDWLNRLNYKIGGFDPFYYRTFNLIIHILAGISVFYLIHALCRCIKNKPFLYNNSLLIAFTTSALFLLHPVQTQTISYVIQARLEGLATLFVLTTLMLFVKAFTSKNNFAKIILIPTSFIVAFLSCGTKEIVVVTPFLLLLVDWFFISQEQWNSFKKRIYVHATFFILFFTVFFHYMHFNFFTRAISLNMSTANNRGNILTKAAYDVITPLHYLISEFKVILHYLLVFVWPFNMSVEYDWKLAENFFSVDSLFPFLILAAIISYCTYLLFKKKNSFITFGLFWFFVTVAPRTSIIPSPELICDYKTYLASIGWLFLIALALVYIIQFSIEKIKAIPSYINNQTYKLAIISVLAVFIGLTTLNRNTVWKSPVNFWDDIVKKAPLKARGHNNLGVALSETGNVDNAIKHYKIAISLDKYYADPLSNISVAYSMKGEIEKAISALKGAINIFPNYPEAYNNLGTLFLKKKNYEEAEKMLRVAIDIRPYYGKAFYNLGRLFLEKKEEEKAWTYFEKATKGDLDVTEGFYTLGQMSLKLKKYDHAAKAFEQVLVKGVKNPKLLDQVQFNLANSYFMLKQLDKAEKLYANLSLNDPLNTKYIYNLAETYLSQEKINQALNLFKKTTTLPKPLAQAHFRIAACYKKLNKKNEAKKYLSELLDINAPEQFKQTVKNELAQLKLEEKIKQGNGSVKMSEIQKVLKQAASSNENKTINIKA